MSNRIGVHVRDKQKRGELKLLRRSGRIPAVVFGTDKHNVSIDVPKKEFMQWMKTGGGSVVYLQLNNEEELAVLLEDMQRDPLTQDIIHIDFLQVDDKKQVRTKLPIVYAGTPVGTKQGAIVQTNSTMIEVQALPAHIPDSLTVDISGLDVGESLQASELNLPDGVSLVSSEKEILISVLAK